MPCRIDTYLQSRYAVQCASYGLHWTHLCDEWVTYRVVGVSRNTAPRAPHRNTCLGFNRKRWIRPMGRTDEGAKPPVNRRLRQLVVRCALCGILWHWCCCNINEGCAVVRSTIFCSGCRTPPHIYFWYCCGVTTYSQPWWSYAGCPSCTESNLSWNWWSQSTQTTSPILCRHATVIRHGLISARHPALTILFHRQERNLAIRPSVWPAQLYGTVYQQQFVKQTV